MNKQMIMDEIINELSSECIVEGYDPTFLNQVYDQTLFLFYHLGKFRCWEALVHSDEPHNINDEDILRPVLKTDYVSKTKIRLIKECILKKVSIVPLLCANYDEASSYTIFCGLISGIPEDELMDNGRLIPKDELTKIIKGRVDIDKLII